MPKTPTIREIASPQHPLIKAVRKRVRAGELLADGEVLLDKPKLVEEALVSGAAISRVLIRSNPSSQVRALLKKLPPSMAVYECAARLFDSLGATESSPGILALAAEPRWGDDDLFPDDRPPLILILAGIQDPGNLGTILRTAEAFGVTGIILSRGTVSPYNAKAVRASAGIFLRLPLLRNQTADGSISLLRGRGVEIFVSAVAGGKSFCEANLAGPAAIVLGSEGSGVPREWDNAGARLTIPMADRVQSINVAIAAAVILYEVARQRNFGGTS